MIMRNMVLALFVSLVLVGCATSINQYEATEPDIALEEFFNGELFAYGIVQNRFGKVQKRFTVEMIGTWQDNVGILEEDFFYADGTTDRRVWRLVKEAENVYSGTADDVSVDAIGSTSGFAFQWTYVLDVPVEDKIWTFKLNDWMYLVDENRLVNRAQMKKFGVVVGEITLVIEKL
jgi:hypothetical protein